MNLEKTLKNLGRCVLGTILATNLFFSCDNGTTTKRDDESKLPNSVGDISGTVLYPTVEDNQVILRPRNNADIYIDGVEKTVSDNSGNFYISNIGQGFREFKAKYNKDYLASWTIFVVRDQLNYLPNIQMSPTSPAGEIVYGIVYTDSTKSSRYNGKLRLTNNSQPITDVSNGVYAFQGFVNNENIVEHTTGKIVIFYDTMDPANEHLTVDLGESWITEQNGYINDKSLFD